MLNEDAWYRVVQKMHPLDAANMCTVSSCLYNNVVQRVLCTSSYPIKLFKTGYSKWEEEMQFSVESNRWLLAKSVDSTLGQVITNRRYFITLEPMVRSKISPDKMLRWILTLISRQLISPVYAVMDLLCCVKEKHLFWNYRASLILAIRQTAKCDTIQYSTITELLTANVSVAYGEYTDKMMYALALQGHNPSKFLHDTKVDYDKMLCFLIATSSKGLEWWKSIKRDSQNTKIVGCETATRFMIHALMSGQESTMEWVWHNYVLDFLSYTCTRLEYKHFAEKVVHCCGTHLLTGGIEFLDTKYTLPDYYNCILMKMAIQRGAQKIIEPPLENEMYAWLYTTGMIPSIYNWRVDVEQNEGLNLIDSWLFLLQWAKSTGKSPIEQKFFVLNAMIQFNLPTDGTMLRDSDAGIRFEERVMELELDQKMMDGLRKRGYL